MLPFFLPLYYDRNVPIFSEQTYPHRDHTVAQLVEAMRYNAEGRGFGSRLCHRNFHSYNHSSHIMALWSTQPLTEMSTKSISWGKGGRYVGLTTLPTSCADCHDVWEPQSSWKLQGLYRDCYIFIFYIHPLPIRGPGSSVGIATGYGLDGPGSNPGGGSEIFRTCPDRPWGPPSLLYNGYRVFPGGKERPGRDVDPSPPSSAVVMKG